MPIDTSIYNNLKPVEMPSYMDSQQKAMSLSQLGMQNVHAAKTMQREDQAQKIAAQKQKTLMFGEAMENLSGMSTEARAAAYPKVRESLISAGVIGPEHASPEYSEVEFKGAMRGYMNTPEYLAKQKTKAEIEHLGSKAFRNENTDPMGFWLAKEKYQERQEAKKKELELHTPYGIANTADDAKKLKDASELKSDFDRKLSEMIALREKHNGGASLNREDVARGKQLSDQLLLAYKDIAKLGVMSLSDEKILRSVIPSDPLEYNLSGLVGQDPTMHKLKQFKNDAEEDFKNRVANRIRGGKSAQADQYAGAPKGGGDVGAGLGASNVNASSSQPPSNQRKVGARVSADEVAMYATKHGMKESEAREYLKGQGYATD